MYRSTDLLRTLDRLARERGWTRADLAEHVGLDRSTLVHAAAGRRILTTKAMARICRALPEVTELKDLYWNYVRYEIPLDADEKGVLPSSNEPACPLPAAVREKLLGYVRAFPTRFVDGQGLIIVGMESRSLSAAASLLQASMAASQVSVSRRLAKDPVHSTEVENLDRARLLVLERVDFAKDAAQGLVRQRLNRLLPVVVTTATPAIESTLGPDIARQLRAQSMVITFPPLTHG